MAGQPENHITIKLKGGSTYLTGDPLEVFEVLSGTVNLYVVRVTGAQLGRSIYLGTAEKGQMIPTLSIAENGENRYWQLLLMAQEQAQLRIHTGEEDGIDLEKIQMDFLTSLPVLAGSEERFSIRLVEFYEHTLKQEEIAISRSTVEKKVVRAGKFNMMTSLFRRRKGLSYQEHTSSPIYNVMSILCDYMNIRICSYQTITSVCGENFDAFEIARVSHFIARRLSLSEQWYHKDSGPIVVFREEDDQPLLCIPKGINRYILYDVEKNANYYVDAQEAALLKPEGLMIYRSFKSHPLTFKDVISHGIRAMKERDVVAFTLMTLLSSLVGLLLPFFNERMFDTLIPMGSLSAIWQVGSVIFACSIGNIFFLLVKNLSTFRATKVIEYEIVNATFDRLFHLPQQFIERYGSSELVNRVLCVPSIFQSMSTGLVAAVLGFLFSIFYVIKMFQKSKALAGRGLFMVLLTAALTLLFGFLKLKYEKRKLETATKANVTLYQFITSIMKVRISGIEDRALYEYQKPNIETLKNDIKSTGISNTAMMISGMMSIFYAGFIYYTVAHKKLTLTIGEYTAFNSAFGMFSSAAMQLVNYFLTMGMVIPIYKRVKPIYEQSTELTDDTGISGRFTGQIEVDHLSFSYANEDKPVLNDISFSIQPGEYIGIVGASGCGKSTLLKCLLGFEKAERGKIYYDNKDIETLDKRELRKQMGVVMQNGKLISGTIFSNVAIASSKITPDEVKALVEEVGLGDDIAHMPMGIFTEVSEFGGTVSGGQQQRILIARALANRPCMVFFDEATSALDNVTQQIICENLARRNMTRVMIAHRLSTVEKCDRILVINEGKIAETGNYSELIEKHGLFYELANRQRVNQDED